MMSNLRLAACFLLLALSTAPAAAQIFPEPPPNQQQRPTVSQQAQLDSYLRGKDIDRAELERRLLAEGIDVNTMTQDELLRERPRIERIINQMEEEQRTLDAEVRQTAAEQSDRIEDAVEEGASVEEAIAEVTAEDANVSEEVSQIYGHQVFRNKSLEVYRNTENATPPPSYPLKPGDEIAVSIFGASQTDFILRLDESGFVTLPNELRIPLNGIALKDARELLARRLRQYYAFSNGQLSIRIQAARTISLNIFGEVERSGTFTMSSLNTGFNALVAAGGPTENGSVRNIQLINGDEVVLLDVYEFLQRPAQRTGLFVEENATIFVPPAQKIVDLRGGVIRPMLYEMKEGESLGDLIQFGGGTLARAETTDIRVTRYDRGTLQVLNVDLTQQPDFGLRNGDVVNVPQITEPVEDFVVIEGAVLLPGQFAFEEGITADELVRRGRLRPGARRDVAFLFRRNDDGTSRLIRVNLGAGAGAEQLELRRGDRLQVLAQASFVDPTIIEVSGAVRNGTTSFPFPQDGALTLDEAVLLAGGLATNAIPEAMVIRTPVENSEERRYQRVNLRTDADFVLQPQDQVIVYSQETFTDAQQVTVGGAVREPGEFIYNPTLRLEDVIFMAGGLRLDAARNRVEVFRLEIVDGVETRTRVTTVDLSQPTTDFVLRPFDEIVVRSAAEFEYIRNVVLEGEVRYPGQYALLSDNERLTDLIARAGGLTAEAFPDGATMTRRLESNVPVVLDLDVSLTNTSNPGNLVLLAGDRISIPKRNDLVIIETVGTLADRFGADSLVSTGALHVAYQGEKSADWYIKRYAGGFENAVAHKKFTTVEYANGQVKETDNFLFIKNYPEVRPGSTIRVALRPEKQQRERREERFDWIGLAQVVVTGVTSVATLIIISNRNRNTN